MKKTSIIKQLRTTISNRIKENEKALKERKKELSERSHSDERDGTTHNLVQTIETLSSSLEKFTQDLNTLPSAEHIRTYQCYIQGEPTILIAVQLCVPVSFKYQGFTVQTANPKLSLIKSIETALANGETSFIIRNQKTGKPVKNAEQLQILS